MSDIDKFVGEWKNISGNRLIIKKKSKYSALVSFYSGKNNNPISKPYDKNLLSIQMNSSLKDYGSSLDVELWQKNRDFCLSLLHKISYDLDNLQRESLVPAFVRNAEDDFLEQYLYLFEPLEHYVKIE